MDKAQVFEVRHDIADGGGAELETQIARQGTRADRLTIANVILDQQLQQMLRAFIERIVAGLDAHLSLHARHQSGVAQVGRAGPIWSRSRSNPCDRTLFLPTRTAPQASTATAGVKPLHP
jgi:hypothetical protein